ncbi:hypothetical protein DEJ33_12725 [Curtobacterium sp. MCPF17_047]|uniref:hypothetical protein n=1 Tax=unclassified Curtobacterium TaxID=257496 RepID=UPI000DA994B3|nr:MULTISPECIES: hypothetical protein [unclassified Curtobacterium]PZE56990.1 hypothetical protein DEJ24_12740 [Curtobacterium sp. MCPF17_001]PZF63979.1 hypothetical protein DEJ33_12725 [Curtobacterium sp. MCPF17_047]
MRPSTILLALLTGVFGAATIVLALLVGTDDTQVLLQVLRLGGLVTIGFGAGLVITVGNRRRRERLQRKSEVSPGTFFVDAYPTGSTYDELDAWRPGLRVWFPCDLGFDRNGITAWPDDGGGAGIPIATRQEVTGLEVFSDGTPLGSTNRWGIAIALAPSEAVSRDAGTATVHLWMLDDQQNHDEYAMRRTISKIETALAGRPTA